MSINITISAGNTGSGIVAHRARYARVDNTTNPAYITVVPDITSFPATIASDIPNGQYLVQLRPIYNDLRTCEYVSTTTPACPGLISINAYIDGSNIVVQYLAESSIPKVKINIAYPNGGTGGGLFVNNGNDIPFAIPTGVTGDFIVTGQSVCDEESGFYSAPSSQVTVTNSATNVTLTSSAGGITIVDIQGIVGFTLPYNLTAGQTITGEHDAFLSTITVTFTGTPAVDENAVLYKNGTQISCTNIPNTSGGSFSFSAASFALTDQLAVAFNTGMCP